MAVNTLRFGLNYVPSKNWWYGWVDWDRESISSDLKAISGLGMDHIRIHCLWPLFQPNPAYVSEAVLDRLGDLMDLADMHGLDVEIAVLDGWLSGFPFAPSWQKGRNMFTDRGMIEAEKLLFTAIAKRVGGHRRFLGFDLGNELGVMHHFGNPITVAEGDAWHREMMALCEELAPGKLNVNGVDHQQWFQDIGFSRGLLSNSGALTSLHTWIEFTGARSLYGYDGIGSIHLAEYCLELAKAYSLDPARQLWIQEFGASTRWMPLEAVSTFAEATIRNAATCGNLWGLTWWCSHDLKDTFTGFDPLEYDLGVLDCNNRVKPVGLVLASLIREFRTNPPQPIERPTALVLPDSIFATLPTDCPPGWQFAKGYMDLIAQGARPAVVLESRSNDAAYLESRGIKELIR